MGMRAGSPLGSRMEVRQTVQGCRVVQQSLSRGWSRGNEVPTQKDPWTRTVIAALFTTAAV